MSGGPLTAQNVLLLVLLAAATAACLAAVWALREAVFTARSMRLLSDDLRERLVPLLDKADVTVDAANAELLRIDGAITRFEDAANRVGEASNTLSEIVQAPAEIVSGVADRVRHAWKHRKRHENDVELTELSLTDGVPDNDGEELTGEPLLREAPSTDTEDPWDKIE